MHRQYGHSVLKESKALSSFLNELETETKLQSFNLKNMLKGSWDFSLFLLKFDTGCILDSKSKINNEIVIVQLFDVKMM